MTKHKFVPGKMTLAALGLTLASLATGTLWHQAYAGETDVDKVCTGESDCADPELRHAIFNHLEKRFFNRINATAEQREKINAILEEKYKNNQGKRLAIKAKAKELGKMTCDPKTPESQIIDKAHELQGLRMSLGDDRIKTMLQIRALLTEEQLSVVQKRFAAIMENRRQASDS